MVRLSEVAFRIFAAITGVILIIWAVYHGVQFYHSPYQTEVVFEYTVSRTLPVAGYTTGIALRREQPIEDRVTGIENYLYDDGARVSVGQTVAEFYSSNVSDQNVKRLREVEKEIAMLREAQDSSVNNFSNAEILSRDLRDQLGSLTEMASAGGYSQVSDIKFNITALLNKRQVATGKVTDFSARLGALEAEYAQLSRTTAGDQVRAAQAPSSGYFSKTVDGYVGILSSDNMLDYSIEQYKQMIEQEVPKTKTNYVGKLTTSQNWYLAVVFHKHDVDWVKEGQRVRLDFDELQSPVSATVEEIILHNDSDDAVLIFYSNQMTGDVINLRRTDVRVQFYSYTGLRINTASIRFLEDEETGERLRGVYVLESNTVTFKTIDPLYEESNFVIADPSSRISEKYRNISLFDQVVTGTDLYHGKVVD